jgi:hypothetical protein
MKKFLMLTAVLAVCAAAHAADTNYSNNPGSNPNNSNRCGNIPPQDQNTPGGYTVPKGDKVDQNFRDNRFKTEADRALYGQIMGGLHDPRFSNVKVMVANGSVTLKGTVSTQQDKADLDAIINRMGASGNTINQVTVQP